MLLNRYSLTQDKHYNVQTAHDKNLYYNNFSMHMYSHAGHIFLLVASLLRYYQEAHLVGFWVCCFIFLVHHRGK